MRQTPIWVPLAAALVGFAALTGCGSDHGSSPSATHSPAHSSSTAAPGGTTAGAAAFNDADTTFAQLMIPHHAQAVQMANLVETRSTSSEVKQLAGQIKGAQQPEIDLMNGWLAAWNRATVDPSSTAHAGAHDPGHEMPGSMSQADLATLSGTTGADFDQLFLSMMVAHHEGAITMAKDQIAKGANPEAKALAERIVTGQQAEIETMIQIMARS